MRRISLGLPAGVALGALAMYFLDPNRGRARRARLRDRLAHLERMGKLAASTTRHDMANRARGFVHDVRAQLRPELVDDDVLVERARSKAGRAVSHPHAIELHARGGTILVSGDVLAHEKATLLKRLRAVRGVVAVEDHLREHTSADGVSLLHGEARTVPTLPLDWPPAARLIAALAGGALAMAAAGKRGLPGALAASAGALLALRGITNLPVGEWLERTLPRREAPPAHAGRRPAAAPLPS